MLSKNGSQNCTKLARLSREEREAAYNKARERIFGKDDKAGDATPGEPIPILGSCPYTDYLDTEDGNEMSRSSSVSTKDRANQNKRPKPTKQRRDDEDFDSRSQYAPLYPQQQVPQAPTWVTAPQYAPMGAQQYNGTAVQNYQSPIPAHFMPPAQQFSPGMMNNGGMQTYNNIPQVRAFLFGSTVRAFINTVS